jgi:4-aminobutyrate aminotransferase-like enzyme
MFGYGMVLPMNTGAEAVETAVKLSRKWAYQKKGVPEGKAIVFSVEGNFHGRTLGVIRYVVKQVFTLKMLYANILIPVEYEHRSREPWRIWTIPRRRRPNIPG